MHRLLSPVALTVLGLAWLAPPPADACSPIEQGSFASSSMPSEGETFPHDASPLIRIGDRVRPSLNAEPVLLDHSESPPLEVETTLVTRVLPDVDAGGSIEWIRLVPTTPLVPDREYGLELRSLEDGDSQDSVDAIFRPVRFLTGRSFVDVEPVAPERAEPHLWLVVPRPPRSPHRGAPRRRSRRCGDRRLAVLPGGRRPHRRPVQRRAPRDGGPGRRPTLR